MGSARRLAAHGGCLAQAQDDRVGVATQLDCGTNLSHGLPVDGEPPRLQDFDAGQARRKTREDADMRIAVGRARPGSTHLGRRIALAEAALTRQDGKLLATATSNCIILR